MTTTITVKSHNYPAKVEIIDNHGDGNKSTFYEYVTADQGPREFYCTTTRTITVTDVEYDAVPTTGD